MLFKKKSRTNKMLALFLAMTMVCSLNVATVFGAQSQGDTADDFDIVVTDENGEAIDDVEASIVPVDEETEVSEEAITEETALEEITDADEEITETEIVDEDITEKAQDEESEQAPDLTVNSDISSVVEEADIMSVSADSIVSINSISYNKVTDLQVTGLKAVINKNYQVKLTWKKPSGSKGKIYYHIYKMNPTGEFAYVADTTKTSWVDKNAQSGALVYMVRPDGQQKNTGAIGEGFNAYAVAAPLIVNAKRTSEVSTNKITVEIDFADTKVDDSMVDYDILRSRKNSRSYFVEVQALSEKMTGADEKSYFKNNANAKIGRILDQDYEGHGYGLTYYYRATAEVRVVDPYLPSNTGDGTGAYKFTAESPSFKTTIYERAPQAVSATRVTGTKVMLDWEDMTGNGGMLANSSCLGVDDYYQIYYKLNGGKLKAYKKIPVKNLPIVDTVDQGVTVCAYEISDGKEIHEPIPQRGYYSTYFLCTGLKANANYEFYVAPIRSNKVGAKGVANIVRTDLNDLDNLEVTQPDDKALTVTWDTVEGATKYELYYKAVNNLTDAETLAAAWQEQDGVPANSERVVVKNTSKKTITYKHKKLAIGQCFVYKVIPVIGSSLRDNKDKDKVTNKKIHTNTGYGNVRLATPVITVKESKGKVTFSWKKVKGAEYYTVIYAKYAKAMAHLDANGNIDVTAEEVDKQSAYAKTSITIPGDLYGSKLYLGEGESIQVKAYSTVNGTVEETSSRLSKIATGFNRPVKPTEVTAVFHSPVSGPTIDIESSYSSSELSNSRLGYRILRSFDGKTYNVVEENYNSTLAQTKHTYIDNDELADGKTVYYRFYSVAVPKDSPQGDKNYQVRSTNYTQVKYCKPKKISRSTVEMTEGESKKVSISFKPSTTTMKQIKSWTLSKTSDLNDNYVECSEKSAGNYDPNRYIKVYVYKDPNTKDFTPEIKIQAQEGINFGSKSSVKTYITAKTVNGLETTFRVEIKKKKVENGGEGKDTIIVLDPGHGGSDTGATSSGLKESEINLKISEYTRDYLEDDYGFKNVYLTRTSDKYVDLEDRVSYAKNKGSKVIISQHINSGGGNGVECYHSIYDGSDSLGTKLAKNLTNYTAEVGFNNRGARTLKGENGDYYAIIRYAHNKSMTGIIMENGFIDNSSDREHLKNDLKKIAKANAAAIAATYK